MWYVVHKLLCNLETQARKRQTPGRNYVIPMNCRELNSFLISNPVAFLVFFFFFLSLEIALQMLSILGEETWLRQVIVRWLRECFKASRAGMLNYILIIIIFNNLPSPSSKGIE